MVVDQQSDRGHQPSDRAGSTERLLGSAQSDCNDLLGRCALAVPRSAARAGRDAGDALDSAHQTGAGDRSHALFDAVVAPAVDGDGLFEVVRRASDDPAGDLGWDVPAGLPATFVITPDGALSDTLMGAQTEADLKAAIGQD